MKKWLKKLFLYLNDLPWTKPTAIITCGAILFVFVGAWVTGRDIPPNATDLGKWFGSAVFMAATGKSTYEHVKNQNAKVAVGDLPPEVTDNGDEKNAV